jgi:hypothetical protein
VLVLSDWRASVREIFSSRQRVEGGLLTSFLLLTSLWLRLSFCLKNPPAN